MANCPNFSVCGAVVHGEVSTTDSKGAWSLVNSTLATPQHVITFRMCTRGGGKSRE